MVNLQSTDGSTCDSCRKLKLHCDWQNSKSFTPKCSRCTKYGLSCLIESKTWTASAQEVFKSTVLHGSSKSVFWGPSSNAGGHPTDLHGTDEMPPTPSVSTNGHRDRQVSHETELDIDRNVKKHLLSIYFDHCQPYFPIVSSYSLRAYPLTPLLEAALYGMACTIDSAIVSWRDMEYIRAFLRTQLTSLFGLRIEIAPQIQTVQALLLICFRAELFSADYSDLGSLSVITSMVCKWAQDLGLGSTLQPGKDIATEDETLRQQVWKGCFVLDAYISACFGQAPNIDPDKWVPLDFYTAVPLAIDNSNWTLAAFDDLILLSRDLHRVIVTYYGVRQFSNEELWRHTASTLQALNYSEHRIASRIQAYDVNTTHVLEIYQHNNRLLLARGIKLNMRFEFLDLPDWKGLIDQQTELVINQALLTLSSLSRQFLHSPYTRMGFPLYFVSRALFLVVEYINTLNQTPSGTGALRQRLTNAIELAKHFSDVLLEENKWGTEWCQGNTMRGMLSHLVPEPVVTQLVREAPLSSYETMSLEPTIPYFDTQESIARYFRSADWDTLIEQYGFESWLLSAYPGNV